MIELKSEIVSASDIVHGDTVEIRGVQYTISRKDIQNDCFLGLTIRGEKFNNGIKRILFPKWSNRVVVGFYPQI